MRGTQLFTVGQKWATTHVKLLQWLHSKKQQLSLKNGDISSLKFLSQEVVWYVYKMVAQKMLRTNKVQ